MKSEQIPQFVQEIIDMGCDITAIANVGYVIGDAGDPCDSRGELEAALNWICKKYGERDHLLLEITAYLISIGRCYQEPLSHRTDLTL